MALTKGFHFERKNDGNRDRIHCSKIIAPGHNRASRHQQRFIATTPGTGHAPARCTGGLAGALHHLADPLDLLAFDAHFRNDENNELALTSSVIGWHHLREEPMPGLPVLAICWAGDRS